MIWSWGHTMQYSALVKGLRLSPTSSLPFDHFVHPFGSWCLRYLKICPVSFASLFFHGGNELPIAFPSHSTFSFCIAFRSIAGPLDGSLREALWPMALQLFTERTAVFEVGALGDHQTGIVCNKNWKLCYKWKLWVKRTTSGIFGICFHNVGICTKNRFVIFFFVVIGILDVADRPKQWKGFQKERNPVLAVATSHARQEILDFTW